MWVSIWLSCPAFSRCLPGKWKPFIYFSSSWAKHTKADCCRSRSWHPASAMYWFPERQFFQGPGSELCLVGEVGGRGGRDGFRMIPAHYIYCALYFYYDYISSTSNHQVLECRGWGPLIYLTQFTLAPLTLVPSFFFFFFFSDMHARHASTS